MNILVLSISPWRNDNSVGNTLSNIFESFPGADFANIYLKSGTPDNSVCSIYYQMNEKLLLNRTVGKRFTAESGRDERKADSMSQRESNFYDILRKKRYTLFFIIRELIWKCCRWKTKELASFVDDFRPDIIFLLLNDTIYSNRIAGFVKKISKKPMVSYVWDDIYAYKGRSPLRWLYQMIVRKAVRKVMKECTCLYTISEVQRQEYAKIFKKECRLLWKGKEFVQKPACDSLNMPLKLVFAGNISGGRWEVLAKIGQALKEINANEKRAELDIYTLTPMTQKMKSALAVHGSVYLKGSLPAEQLKRVQSKADILVHVEAFRKKYKKAVRQSFSTKLVDCMASAKCIFAVGSSEVASIDYLIKNDAAVVAGAETEIKEKLRSLCESPNLLAEYGEKAWECGRKNHQIRGIQDKLRNDFEEIINEGCTN